MNSEGVIGVDRPPRDPRRIRWWQIALLVVFLLAALVALVDALVETSGEGASDAYIDYQRAAADGDGEKACSLLTPEGQEEVAAQLRLFEPDASCEKAVETLADANPPGASERADELDADDLETSVDGDEATIEIATSPLTFRSTALKDGDGEWRLASPTERIDVNPSGDAVDLEDTVAAADALCVAAFKKEQIQLAELAAAIEAKDLDTARGSAVTLAALSDDLSDQLAKLGARGEMEVVRALLPALQEVATAYRRMRETQSEPAGTLNPLVTGVLQAQRAFTEAARDGGFSTSGCALPPARP